MPAELRSARSAAAVVVVSCLVTPSSAAILPGMGKLFDKATGGGSAGTVASAVVDSAPSWEALDAMLRKASTDEELAFRSELESGRGERASALATKRLFDLPDGQEPRLTLYRDTAAWCPYCEKVWLTLEEKRVPYKVEKVNMNCYGEKPAWFWAMQPSGGIPVAKLDGEVIRESNDIIMAVESAFPEARPLLPSPEEEPEKHARVRPLLTLERELFSAWFRWVTSSMSEGAQRANFESLLRRVDEELAVGGGPFFLGGELSLVDVMFAPFLERMAASLAYYKGLTLRRNEQWPRIEAWFLAMEGRPSYRHIQSDFYTHVNDLPPQIGRCQAVPEAQRLADEIDGADGTSWRLPLPDDDGTRLEPLDGLGLPDDAARREAAERLLHNRAAVAKFASRGLGRPGFPAVSAELSDPNAAPNAAALPLVDAALRHTVDALLDGTDAARARLSDGVDPAEAARALGYLRDRISVPRDMSYPAARQLRAHLNFVIEAIGDKHAAAATQGGGGKDGEAAA